jgi:hypothetical protein
MNRGIIIGIIGSLLAALTLAFIPIDQWVQYFPLWLQISEHTQPVFRIKR